MPGDGSINKYLFERSFKNCSNCYDLVKLNIAMIINLHYKIKHTDEEYNN